MQIYSVDASEPLISTAAVNYVTTGLVAFIGLVIGLTAVSLLIVFGRTPASQHAETRSTKTANRPQNVQNYIPSRIEPEQNMETDIQMPSRRPPIRENYKVLARVVSVPV